MTAATVPPRAPFLCRPVFLWTLVALGAALRIFQYASDTSFWFDELSLVRNIVHRTEAQLATVPLRYDQVAPVGFLVAEKAISRVLGESDLAFRFLLLPVGLFALVLFVPLARRLLDGYAVPFAVAMFVDRRAVHPLLRGGQAVRHRHGRGHRDVTLHTAAA